MITDKYCEEVPQEIIDFYEQIGIEQIYIALFDPDGIEETIIAKKNGNYTSLGFIDSSKQRRYYYYENIFSEEQMLKLIKLKAFL